MTTAELGAALRGIPRDARVVIDTPDGLRELRLVQAVHAWADQDGKLVAGRIGDYAMVLYPEGRPPRATGQRRPRNSRRRCTT
jgi:hypothetical protein